MQVVLHPEHRLAKLKRPLELADLAQEPLIMYESEPSTDHQLFVSQGLTPKIVASVPQMILVSAMVGRGLGYGLLMRRPNNAQVSVEGRPLAFRELKTPNYPNEVVAITPYSVRIPARVQALIEHCRCAMAESW